MEEIVDDYRLDIPQEKLLELMDDFAGLAHIEKLLNFKKRISTDEFKSNVRRLMKHKHALNVAMTYIGLLQEVITTEHMTKLWEDKKTIEFSYTFKIKSGDSGEVYIRVGYDAEDTYSQFMQIQITFGKIAIDVTLIGKGGSDLHKYIDNTYGLYLGYTMCGCKEHISKLLLESDEMAKYTYKLSDKVYTSTTVN